MKLNKHTTIFTSLILLFNSICFMGCLSTLLGGQPRPPQDAVVGLKLKSGETCNYTAQKDGYSFDITFNVTKEGDASFKRIAVKTPTVNYVHEGGSWSIVGGNIQISMFDLKIEVNPVVARVCAGEKCFTATLKARGDWVVKQLPFPASVK